MPYIHRDRRDDFADALDELSGQIESVGELNYVMSVLALRCLMGSEMRYADRNAIAGVFSCAGQEFYRRWIAPYEDQKIDDPEYGDIE